MKANCRVQLRVAGERSPPPNIVGRIAMDPLIAQSNAVPCPSMKSRPIRFYSVGLGVSFWQVAIGDSSLSGLEDLWRAQHTADVLRINTLRLDH